MPASVRSASIPRRRSFADAALALAADASADPAPTTLRLRWCRRVVLAWGAARSAVWLSLDAPIDAATLTASTVLLLLAAGLAWAPRFEAWAGRVALPALGAQLLVTLPLTPNHFFLELYAVAILACAERDRRDDGLVLAGLRWLTAIVLFLTGVQKLAYGHYWTGDFLAFMVGRGDRFADLFQWVLPASEVTRLQSYDPFRGDMGPYRVRNALFILMSNAVWIAELVLPIGLVVRRTRTAAVGAALVFVVALQLGAREMGFAILFTNLLLLFAPLPAVRILSGASLAALGWVAAAALGLAPGAALLQAWHLW